MSQELDIRGAHRAVRSRASIGTHPNRRRASAGGLVVAGALGIGSMLVVMILGGASGGEGSAPPMTLPTADVRLPDSEPPELEFTMSAWPSDSAAPPATRTAGLPTSAASPGTGVSPPLGQPAGVLPVPSPTPPPVLYSAVAGYGCPNSATHGFSEVGRYTDGTIGWYTVSTGGWTGNGCTGKFDAMEMSGYATVDDPDAYALWWFSVGGTAKSCQVSVYVPKSSNSQDVAGKPAQYYVLDTETGPIRASFTIDQRYTRGQWVTGSYAARGGRLVVKLVSRGEDWTEDSPTHEHIAVSQVRVTCTG